MLFTQADSSLESNDCRMRMSKANTCNTNALADAASKRVNQGSITANGIPLSCGKSDVGNTSVANSWSPPTIVASVCWSVCGSFAVWLTNSVENTKKLHKCLAAML